MNNKMLHRLPLALACLLPPAAAAQGAPAPRPDPLDAQAVTAPLAHRSAFAGYRRIDAETPPLTWREANDRVEQAGGWRALAREAHAPDPAASAATSAPPRSPAGAAPAAPPASAPRMTRPATPTAGHRH